MKRIVFKTSDSIRTKMFSSVAAKTAPPKDINITPAVKRSPTAILEALSSTVGGDPTAPHFAFVDDPAMIPSTAANKRNYYLAKEMGKRAARQLAEEWPTLFAFDRDQPELPIFRPTKLADPLKVEPTEGNLLKMINSRKVQDSVMLYERMRTENLNVSEATQKELFQLLCYYNEADPPATEVEEWHGFRNYSEEQKPAVFKQGGLAMLLFETLPKSPQNVSTMITALCKYPSKKSRSRAKELYQEYYNQKGYIFRNAFDALIATSSWSDAKNILGQMNKSQVKPTISTFNSLLISAARNIPEFNPRHEAFEEVIGEMHALNITPSLTSYNLIFKRSHAVFSGTEEGAVVDQPIDPAEMKVLIAWLDECLNELESRPVISLDTAADSIFFTTAMEIACKASNLELADKVVNVYESKKNEVKLPALTVEGVFYNLYLMLYVDVTQSIEDIEKKYRSFVPRLVGVNRQLSLALCSRLEKTPHWPLLRRVIEDGIASRHSPDAKMASTYRHRLIDVPLESLNVAERAEYAEIVNRMTKIAMELANFTDERQNFMQQKLHPYQVSQLALLLNRIGESEKAYKLLELLLDEDKKQGPKAIVQSHGEANPNIMLELFDAALREGDVYRAATCLEVISLTKPRERLEQLVVRIHNSCKLTSAQKRLIDGYVRLRPE